MARPQTWRGARPHKFGAQSITLNGPDGRAVKFPSHMQAGYVVSLWRRLLAGEIWDLELEPSWPIHVIGPDDVPAKVGSYKPDAVWREALELDGVVLRAVDVGTKNTMTPVKRFKIKCVEAQHGVRVEHVEMSDRRSTELIAAWSAGILQRAST